jgi:hypothetical protein
MRGRWVVALAMTWAQACGGPAVPHDGGDPRQQEALLARLKEQRFLELARQLEDAAGEQQRMGVLLQLADLGTAPAIGLIDRSIDSVADRPTLLNAVASKGFPAAGPLLMRAVRSWGPDAGHPIERLHGVFGPEIAADLRRLREETSSDAVRRAIDAELIRLGDVASIEGLRRALTGARLQTELEAQRAIELLSAASDSTELAAEVGLLFRRVDPTLGKTHRQLKQYAAGIALWLGDRDSAGHVIDLLASPGSAYFSCPGLFSLDDILRRRTHRSFPSPQEWKSWWASTGRLTPLFTTHVPPGDEAGIINATMAWGRASESGPLVKGAIVYLEDDSKYRRGRSEVWAGLEGSIRVYTAAEITLLGVRPYSVSGIESDGRTAFATLGDGTNRSNWRLERVRLSKQDGAWHAARTVPGDFSLTLARGGCEGSCPEYAVTLDSRGGVLWEGRRSVALTGSARKVIAQADLESIARRVAEMDVFGLPAGGRLCLDTPDLLIEITANGRTKSVRHDSCSQAQTAAGRQMAALARWIEPIIVTAS